MEEYTKTEWYLYNKKADFYGIAARFGIHPVTAKILRNRDIVTDEDIALFLGGSADDLYDGRLLPAAEKAAESLAEDIRKGKSIRIIGDYDIDGVCASYILIDGLRNLGARVTYRIPDRVKDGYGINEAMVKEAQDDGIDTLITCDNGISAMEELAYAKKCGMKVIVTDHHDIRHGENGEEILPPADFILNAKSEASRYPEKEICGAVTAWKFLRILYEIMGAPLFIWDSYFEFAGLATIGDVMNLTGENRIIAKEALQRIERGPVNPGLRALWEECGLSGKKITCYHVGFILGPTINAAGRIASAELALSLFLSKDPAETAKLAKVLTELNESRKAMTIAGQEKAVQIVEEEYSEDKVLSVYLPDLHESMAGIVAGRLKEIFGKPSLVFTNSGTEGILKGSGRSIENYPMFEALSREADLLLRFGGHPMAAGLSLKKENLPELRRRLSEHSGLTGEDFTRRIMIDAAMPMSYVTMELIEDLRKLEPYGTGNQAPLFAEKGVKPYNLRILGKNRNTLRMTLLTKDGFTADAICFGEADRMREEIESFGTLNILYYPEINEYNGRISIQFRVEGYKKGTV